MGNSWGGGSGDIPVVSGLMHEPVHESILLVSKLVTAFSFLDSIGHC